VVTRTSSGSNGASWTSTGFRQQFEVGRRALASGQPEAAATALTEALALWRGPPLADFTYEPFARAEVERLEELRLAALTERIEADLALGRHVGLVGELELLVERHPLQERLAAQLMLALYRSGRQAEALQVYRRTWHALVEQMGIEPGRALQTLQRAILTHDPSLELQPGPVPATATSRDGRRRTRWALPVVVVAALVVAGAVAGVAAFGGRKPTEAVDQAQSVGVIDPRSNEVVDRVAIGLLPSAIATSAGDVWVLNQGDTSVSRIDGGTGRVTRTIGLGENHVGATSIAFGYDAAWVGNGYEATVTRVNLQNGTERPFRIHGRDGIDVLFVATASRALWVVSTRHSTISELDLVTGRIFARAGVPAVPLGIAAGDGAVWVISNRPARRNGDVATSGILVRIDPATATVVSKLPLPFAPSGVAVGFGDVWVAVNSQNAVLRIDPRTNAVERTISVGHGPNAVVAGADAIWVVNARDRTVSRIDPKTNEEVATIDVAGTPGAIASGSGKIWVTGI
jgi:YVTN family beta-propeller protein